MYRGLLSSPRAAKRKREEVSLSATPKRCGDGSSSPNVSTHGQVASCPEEENKNTKFSSSFPPVGGEYHCELSNSDEDIDSKGSGQQIQTGASARAGKMPKRRHVSQIKAKYMGRMEIYTRNRKKVETERFQVQIGGKSSRTVDTFQGVIVDTAITCKDSIELTDLFEDKLVKRFRRREDDKTFDENELEAWEKELKKNLPQR
jgi:hypothetical protein